MKIFLLLACLLLAPIPVLSMNFTQAKFERYIGLYENGEYEMAIDSLQHLLSGLKGNEDELAIEVNKYLGFAFVMNDRIDSAKIYFNSMLTIDSRKKLDPIMVPPNIYSVFREVRLQKDLDVERRKKRKNIIWFTGGAAVLASGGLIYMLLRDAPETEVETGAVQFDWEIIE